MPTSTTPPNFGAIDLQQPAAATAGIAAVDFSQTVPPTLGINANPGNFIRYVYQKPGLMAGKSKKKPTNSRDEDEDIDETQLRRFDDPKQLRKAVYDKVLEAANNLQPISDGNYFLTLTNARYIDPENVSLRERKQALLEGKTIGRRLKGTWVLSDANGNEIERRDTIVARVPTISDSGTITHNGVDYILAHQQRLNSGIFTRRKANNELETHVNVVPGQGVSHRYLLDPVKGVFKIKIGAAEIPALPLLKALGASDRELAEAWGSEIYKANATSNNEAVLKKIADRLLPKHMLTNTKEPLSKLVADYYANMPTDPNITRNTLGQPFTKLEKNAVIAATKKLLAVSRGEEEPDDRDHLAYQTFLGPEDLFAERLTKDAGKLRKKLFREVLRKKSLSAIPSGALTKQLEQAIINSGLGNALEEINPAEMLDKITRVTRMGEGGLPSEDAIPDESRSVNASQLGLLDPVRTPESIRAGVDLFFAHGARKGPNGQLYTKFLDMKTGKMRWRSAQQLAAATVAFPDALKPKKLPDRLLRYATEIRMKPKKSRTPEENEILEYVDNFEEYPEYVTAIRKGKIDYVHRDEIDYVYPHMEEAFSPLGNLVFAKSADKGQRVAMGSRMLTQALALENPEAPLVRNMIPETDGKDYYELYGPMFGAIRSEKPGKVKSVENNVITVAHEDGSESQYELAENFPYNRKAFIHQTPVVRPGDIVEAGGLLARSNFTDDKGHIALGLNLRTMYLPWAGPANHEDAVVISESAAKRLRSVHAYQHSVDKTDKTFFGKNKYVSIFPGTFDNELLKILDDNGVVKPGTVVKKGDPLILAVREREVGGTKVLKKAKNAFSDATVLWDYEDPGVVTDVAQTKNGPVVVVKSVRETRVGDKLSGTHGDKGVIAKILPDSQMPVDAEGNPAELLVSPTGLLSRANAAQKIELILGKVAKKIGKPVVVPDFEDIDDLTEWAEKLAAQHGISDLETVTDPMTGRKIEAVPVGNRYILKLHHIAEDKLSGRDSGGYSSDEQPTKGGESGCFTGDTMIRVIAPDSEGKLVLLEKPIAEIVRQKLSWLAQTGPGSFAYITDWFERNAAPEDLLTIELENGRVIHATKHHRFYLADGSYKTAEQLNIGDDLAEV